MSKSSKTILKTILTKLFKIYVRYNLEYNTKIWSPYLKKYINKIESVQKNFTRFTRNRCNMGMGLNCTKKKLHEVTKLHEGTKFHEDDFAPRVNFTRVTFLDESKKIEQKNRIKKL